MATALTLQQFRDAKALEQEIDALEAMLPALRSGSKKHIVLAASFPADNIEVRDIATTAVELANVEYLAALEARLSNAKAEFDALWEPEQQGQGG